MATELQNEGSRAAGFVSGVMNWEDSRHIIDALAGLNERVVVYDAEESIYHFLPTSL